MNSASITVPVEPEVVERRCYEDACACGCGASLEVKPEHRWNRIPRFLPGHNAKTGFEVWVAENRGKHLCACGCGEAFEPTRRHRREGFPRFKRGHAGRVVHAVTANVAAWVREQQGKHLCACGCGQPIRIYATYRWEGIPRFRRACMLRLRVRENHPNWVEERTAVRRGRNGAYFVPSVRREVLEREEHRCRVCGSTERLVVDHIVPISAGGSGDAANGQVLCSDCHDIKSVRERRHKNAEVESCP